MAANELEEIREQLAAIEHERWADWQKWCHKILRANIKHDIEPTLARWERQIATPYAELTREEQLSDLEQVDRYWPIILSLIESEKVKAVEESLNKSLTLLQDIMRENFMYRHTCGDLGEDVARMYAEYRELEPEREQFTEYYERRVKGLESKEEA